jgi:hypothetical protein
MANTRISQFPIGTPTSTSVFPFIDNGINYKGAISAITSTDKYLTGGTYSNGTLTLNQQNGDITITGFTSGSSQNYVEVTYSELVDNINGSTLNPGSYYLINDFQTCYDQPDFDYDNNPIITGNYKQGLVEPILVLATSTNTISDVAYQPTYPNDKIKYDWTWNLTEVTSGTSYGRITERIDEFNNRTDYDHRTILFKRYGYIELNMNNPLAGVVDVSTTTPTEMSVIGVGTNFTSFGIGDLIGFGSDNGFKSYQIVSISGDTNMVITGLTNFTSSNVRMYNSYYQNDTSYYQNNITTAFTEYYTFDYNNTNINNYVGNFANMFVYEENSFILANNVFKGSTYINNTFGNNCFNNSFDDDCENNIIGNYFYNNNTDDDFDGNVIGNYFNNNKITSNFQYNRIGENFEFNYLVQSSFYRNNIGNGFEYNIVDGDNFQNNEIGNGFNNNTILNGQFYKNDIGNGYNGNKTYNSFFGNLIGNGFNYNTIYSEFYDNQISEYFTENTIGYDGNYSEFYKNIIGPGFYSNDISGYTFTNRIGEQFENNTIYGDFYDNQIFNEFKGNITYQDFNTNKVDWGFGANEFSGSCGGNVFGPFTTNNDFLGIVFGNVIKGDFNGNTIGDVFATNNIGSDFYNNTIAQYFGNNEIGNFFNANTIGEGFGFGGFSTQKNYIGDNFYNNTIGEYFYNNRVSNYFQNNTLGHYFQWNVINTDINSVDFTPNYGNITTFTYTTLGTGTTNGIYTNILGSTSGNGVNASFDIEVSGNTVIGVSGNTFGKLYQTGDTITILGSQIGGVTGVISGFSTNKLSVKIYKPADSTYQFPDNEIEMDYLIDNSPLFDTYYSPNVQGVSYSTKTGIDQNQYGMVIDGYIEIPSGNIYYFGLSSDDGSDAFINGTKVADWYGAHGDNGNIPDGNQYPITLTAGTHSVKVRLQERFGQDIVSLLYSLDGISWDVIPNSWFSTLNITGTTGSYPNIIAQGTGGENATFDVTVIDGVVDSVVLSNGGGSYSIGETLTIPGSAFGGTEEITITVDSVYSDDVIVTVTGVSSNPSVYEHYTCQIFEIRGGNKRLSFYDESEVLNITNINE